MFRKIVSNLAFSPALVGQLGFYAKRLKKEEATRRLGLIFTALALIVQSFAVFQPPESANASNPSNFIQGGIRTIDDFLRNYDGNNNNIKDLFTTLGITRADITRANYGEINSKDVYSWGLTSRFSAAQGERSYPVGITGGVRDFYYRPLSLWDTGNNVKTGSYYKAYIGKASNGTWFAIQINCGNLLLKQEPIRPPCPAGETGQYPDCQPAPKMCETPGKTHLPANDANCRAAAVASCDLLTINKSLTGYRFVSTASTANGAKITGYEYVIKRDGIIVDTKKASSAETSNIYDYTQKNQGAYTVELIVKTNLGDRTAANCVKTFNITPPPVCSLNPALAADSPECQPCPSSPTLWIKDSKCAAALVSTKSAQNSTQGVNATKSTAKASDRIVYTLNVENRGLAPATYTIEEHLDDVMEYATVLDNGGGTLTNKVMSWPDITLKSGEKQSRMFTVQVLSTIPTMGQGTSDKTSYDCKMINTFGNSVTIDIDCPAQKQIVEQAVAELPHTGPTANMVFAGLTLAIVAYFYARSRQMKQEVRLIRRGYNAGTI